MGEVRLLTKEFAATDQSDFNKRKCGYFTCMRNGDRTGMCWKIYLEMGKICF